MTGDEFLAGDPVRGLSLFGLSVGIPSDPPLYHARLGFPIEAFLFED